MKVIFLLITLIISLPIRSFAQEELVFGCITLTPDFRPDGGSFNVHVPLKGSKVAPPQAITEIKGNALLKGFQAEAPASALLCNNGEGICGFSLNLESKNAWIEMSSRINLGKDTSSIERPSGFLYTIKSYLMKDLAEKEFFEAEMKDHKIGHVFHFEQATGLDKAKRTIAMRIQCGPKS